MNFGNDDTSTTVDCSMCSASLDVSKTSCVCCMVACRCVWGTCLIWVRSVAERECRHVTQTVRETTDMKFSTRLDSPLSCIVCRCTAVSSLPKLMAVPYLMYTHTHTHTETQTDTHRGRESWPSVGLVDVSPLVVGSVYTQTHTYSNHVRPIVYEWRTLFSLPDIKVVRVVVHPESKSTSPSVSYLRQILTHFQNSCTTLSRKCTMKWSLNIRPNLKCVAMLPFEILMLRN